MASARKKNAQYNFKQSGVYLTTGKAKKVKDRNELLIACFLGT